MRRDCKICGHTWDASSKTNKNQYLCPHCDESEKVAEIVVRYPTPSRKFRHNKKSRSAGRLFERLTIQSI